MKECERVRLKMNVLKTQYMTTREGGEMKKIPVQVPAIKICFMSIDEIAWIFSKSQSLYRGGEFGRAYIGTSKELKIL